MTISTRICAYLLSGVILHHYYCTGSVIVKCAQTGKEIDVKSGDLYPEGEEQRSKAHLTPGSALLLEEDGKPYPVQFCCYKTKKHFLQNVKNVGITMPKSIQTRCGHGTMQ